VELLRGYGIDRALVSSGTSSVYALGAPPERDGWPISIRDPRDAERALDRLVVRDGAISTSGSYEQAYTIGGASYGHLIDPISGAPVTATAATVAVTRNATDGDAVSTAWYVLGRDRALACRLSESPILALFYLHDEGQDPMRRFVEWGAGWDSEPVVRVRLEDSEATPNGG
jgi:thiamine biosynthesis lipoprotein ApbE